MQKDVEQAGLGKDEVLQPFRPKTILVFRCHDSWEKCRERLRILRHFNPDLPIYVLYGGTTENLDRTLSAFEGLIQGLWHYQDYGSATWKWSHGDAMAKEWYKQVGCTLNFTHLYFHEWDILALAPLHKIYPQFEQSAVYVSPVRLFTIAEERKWMWTRDGKWQWSEFQRYLIKHYGIGRPRYISIGPGMVFSREFMELYSEVPLLQGAHDERSVPALTEAFKLPLKDSGVYTHPRNARRVLWNTVTMVRREQIQQELTIPEGMRIFHPVKYMVELEEVMQWMGQGNFSKEFGE